MLTRLAHLLRAEVMALTATKDAVDLVKEDREDIKLLLIHFRLRHKIYSLSLRCVALSQFVRLTSSNPVGW